MRNGVSRSLKSESQIPITCDYISTQIPICPSLTVAHSPKITSARNALRNFVLSLEMGYKCNNGQCDVFFNDITSALGHKDAALFA